MLSLLVAALLSLASAQSVQQSWIAPSMPDLSTTITEGVPFTLTWDNTLQNWFGSYAPEAVTTNVTLWFASVQLPYAHIIQQFVDVTRVRQITWTPSLPAAEYANGSTWSFRFTPSNITDLSQAGASQEEIDSPQVKFVGPSSSISATSSTVSATSTSTSSSTPMNMNMSSGLSHGAIAGIAIGAIAGALLFLLLILVLFRLRRVHRANQILARQSQQSHPFFGPHSDHMGSISYPGSQSPRSESARPYFAAMPPDAELPDVETHHELEATDKYEMDGAKEKKPGEMEGK